jgi:mannose-6-phosphate isomerase-like protein (cupin superfamily)
MIRSSADTVKPFVTKDGSIIQELMHPVVHGNKNASLAKAVVPPGRSTFFHSHAQSEEMYFFLSGKGKMTLADENFMVKSGDTVLIAPGQAHSVTNSGTEDLVFLCVCAPAYSHQDTFLCEEK